jgi:hypothetical protein
LAGGLETLGQDQNKLVAGAGVGFEDVGVCHGVGSCGLLGFQCCGQIGLGVLDDCIPIGGIVTNGVRLGDYQGFKAFRCNFCGGAVKLGVVDELKVKIAAHVCSCVLGVQAICLLCILPELWAWSIPFDRVFFNRVSGFDWFSK